MKELPEKLQQKLLERNENGSLRFLGNTSELIDFSSNDYLGFAKSERLFNLTNEILATAKIKQNGATGSRLLSGNHALYDTVEKQIAEFHNVEAALIFNSGYDANVGLLSSLLQRGDTVIYDALCHASIRDGIAMSVAKSYKFRHNDLNSLRELLERFSGEEVIYVITESVFSMDGDTPDLYSLVKMCNQHGAYCIVDEAHALGVVGKSGKGSVQELNLEKEVFARIVTFGKALGGHGAAILGGKTLISYLVNFARSLIYTTGLSPHTVATIAASYEMIAEKEEIKKLHHNIAILHYEIKQKGLSNHFIESKSAIHSMILPGNKRVKNASASLAQNGLDVKPILSPTVPQGEERLRICMHSFNSESDIQKLVQHLATFVA